MANRMAEFVSIIEPLNLKSMMGWGWGAAWDLVAVFAHTDLDEVTDRSLLDLARHPIELAITNLAE